MGPISVLELAPLVGAPADFEYLEDADWFKTAPLQSNSDAKALVAHEKYYLEYRQFGLLDGANRVTIFRDAIVMKRKIKYLDLPFINVTLMSRKMSMMSVKLFAAGITWSL
jgi:hypothetical protein